MNGELVWLALTCGLILLLWVPYILSRITTSGLMEAMRVPTDPEALPGWAKRCYRAHMNLVENLAPFAALVLILTVSGKANGATVTAAAIFFFARVAHAGIYIMGIPYARTGIFALGWAVCLFLFLQAIS